MTASGGVARRDITGKRFGHLVAVRPDGDGSWLCRCDCGRTRSYKTFNIVNGYHMSCGTCGARRADPRRFTDDEVSAMAEMWGRGVRVEEIADSFGVNNATIYRYAIRHRDLFPSRRGAGVPKDKAHLIERMWADGATAKEIARAVGATASAVRHYAFKHRDKCPRRMVMLTDEEIGGISRMWADGSSVGDIARYYGVSVTTVRRYVGGRPTVEKGGSGD